MPIEPPDLTDLTYAKVRDLLISRIPVYTPEWTDHNDSDPGIALIQLFAWMSDQIGYRLNRVPDRSYIEFLKLIGIRLRPAEPATTRLAFYLSHPESLPGRFAIPAGSVVEAATADKPSFETSSELDAVPAQVGAILTTRADDLRNLSAHDPLDDDQDAEAWLDARYALVWDGKTPKPEELPAQPVRIGQVNQDSTHTRIWLGLVFNPAPSAGFLGQRVTLTLQLDDDEQPDSFAEVMCANELLETPAATAHYRWYRPRSSGESTGNWVPLTPLSDTTAGFSRSGELRFDVPEEMGPIPNAEWGDVRSPPPLTMQEICDAATANPDETPAEPVPHPLPGSLPNSVDGLGALSVPISGWICVEPGIGNVPAISLRALSFNVAPATQARTVRGELLGHGDGKPGQTARLANPNILTGSLALAVEDTSDGLLHDWTAVESFDAAGADASVYRLDAEAGSLTFGDGIHGRPPPLGARIVALRYQHGGDTSGNLGPGTINKPVSLPSAVGAVNNIVAARGGRDAETLEEAKQRAPRELKIMQRAVTGADFEFLALQTPGVVLGRAKAVPLRRPFDDPADGPGLNLDEPAAGAVAVIAVPRTAGLFPRPTAGEMRAVCRWLDQHRLVTTEVHVVPPMYVRLYNFEIKLTAEPGFSAANLREAITEDLEAWLHVLGGNGGSGFPFGGVLTHSAILARLFSVPGVKRVENLELWFDGKSPADADGNQEQIGRDMRLTARHLLVCPDPENSEQVDRIELLADEVPFVDAATMALEVDT